MVRVEAQIHNNWLTLVLVGLAILVVTQAAVITPENHFELRNKLDNYNFRAENNPNQIQHNGVEEALAHFQFSVQQDPRSIATPEPEETPKRNDIPVIFAGGLVSRHRQRHPNRKLGSRRRPELQSIVLPSAFSKGDTESFQTNDVYSSIFNKNTVTVSSSPLESDAQKRESKLDFEKPSDIPCYTPGCLEHFITAPMKEYEPQWNPQESLKLSKEATNENLHSLTSDKGIIDPSTGDIFLKRRPTNLDFPKLLLPFTTPPREIIKERAYGNTFPILNRKLILDSQNQQDPGFQILSHNNHGKGLVKDFFQNMHLDNPTLEISSGQRRQDTPSHTEIASVPVHHINKRPHADDHDEVLPRNLGPEMHSHKPIFTHSDNGQYPTFKYQPVLQSVVEEVPEVEKTDISRQPDNLQAFWPTNRKQDDINNEPAYNLDAMRAFPDAPLLDLSQQTASSDTQTFHEQQVNVITPNGGIPEIEINIKEAV